MSDFYFSLFRLFNSFPLIDVIQGPDSLIEQSWCIYQWLVTIVFTSNGIYEKIVTCLNRVTIVDWPILLVATECSSRAFHQSASTRHESFVSIAQLHNMLTKLVKTAWFLSLQHKCHICLCRKFVNKNFFNCIHHAGCQSLSDGIRNLWVS